MRWGWLRQAIAGLGRGRGRGRGLGPVTRCVCPVCGYVLESKPPGVSCRQLTCPKCGSPMVGERCGFLLARRELASGGGQRQ